MKDRADRRYRRDEHHAGLRNGAHAGNRRQESNWRPPARHRFSVSDEAATLTGLGGILGILVGSGIAALIQTIMPTYIPVWAPIAGFVVSVGLGVIFGLWPAWKAARLNPIEALRYE